MKLLFIKLEFNKNDCDNFQDMWKMREQYFESYLGVPYIKFGRYMQIVWRSFWDLLSFKK